MSMRFSGWIFQKQISHEVTILKQRKHSVLLGSPKNKMQQMFRSCDAGTKDGTSPMPANYVCPEKQVSETTI